MYVLIIFVSILDSSYDRIKCAKALNTFGVKKQLLKMFLSLLYKYAKHHGINRSPFDPVVLAASHERLHGSLRLKGNGIITLHYQMCKKMRVLFRCIRHRDDWGAIIMVDDRYAQRPKYVAGLSKWVRSSVVHFSDCNQMTNRLEEFRFGHSPNFSLHLLIALEK